MSKRLTAAERRIYQRLARAARELLKLRQRARKRRGRNVRPNTH